MGSLIKRKSVAIAAAAGLTALAGAGGAQAASTGLELLSGFNNIVLGDLDARAETEGTIFVGGDYNGGATVNPAGLPNVDLGGGVSGGFIVGGDIAGNPNVNNGDVVVGGTITGSLGNNGGGTVTENVSNIPVAEVAAVLEALSIGLSGLGDTGGEANTSDQNDINFRSVPNADGFAIFNIDASVLQTGTFKGVDAPDGVTTIVNVAGAAPVIGVNANQTLDDVIFNFFEATVLQVNSAFNYSVLAPFADVTLNGGGVNGTFVSRSLIQNAEIRPGTFAGDLPTVTPVSLPPSALFLIAALAGVGFVTRKRA